VDREVKAQRVGTCLVGRTAWKPGCSGGMNEREVLGDPDKRLGETRSC
jgi:hypothetical protein